MWYYKGDEIWTLEDIPNHEEVFGFVYIIYNLTKKKSYIGRKQLFSVRKKALGKKELALLTDKRAKKYKMVTTESKWVDYNGSNKELLKDIADGDIIEKSILKFVTSKAQLTYFETKYQFFAGCIEQEGFYNDNILGKFYRKIFE